MARKQPEGRYEVEDQAVPSIGAALGFASHRAINERRTVYVREIGVQAAVGRAEYHETDRSVTVHTTKEETWEA